MDMKTNLILATAFATLAATSHLACSDSPPNYGVPENLSCQNPANAVPVDSGRGGSGGGGGTDDAGSGETEAGSDGGCSGADGGCPNFANDIYLLMKGAWACTSPSCHGGGSYPPTIDPNSESSAYQALSNFSPSYCPNQPFVHSGSTDPSATSFMSVFTGTSCGAQMPLSPGQLGPDDMCLVESWIACGMHEN
jgi:hypothetical protein